MDLHQLPAPNGRPGLLALPSPAPSEIRLALPPVATPALAADDIWSDEAAPGEEPAAPSAPPPAAEDRPPALDGAPADRDNLRRIKGIGQGFEKRLNQLGIYRYAQIAAWTEKQQAWVSAELGFPGRVERDDWPVQAGRLAKGTDARAGSQTQIVRDP
jgi:predicted flap endonuclease-1-like 5' DNA nuclease